MKKFLVVLLACALIFGFASTAMAADTQITEFSDIADQSQAAKNAIMKLAVLGVLEGNEGVGGPIRPADNLTRAEFAKIVCFLTGNVKSAEALASVASRFPDVQVGSWYTGWINMAVQAGYFVGNPDGNFRPNANITQNEVVTVCLRAMGYTDALPGSWPGNYATKASAIEILDNVTFVGSAAATRAEAAIICDAVLTKHMVVHVSNEIAFAMALSSGDVDKDGFAEVYYMSNEEKAIGDDGERLAETILHKAFKCDYPRVVFENGEGYDEAAAWGYVDYEDGELEFLLAGGDLGAVDREIAEKYYINKGFSLIDLAGMQADLVVNDDDEVMFVKVRTSYVYADKIYKDGERVNADGKSYRQSTASMLTSNVDFDLTADADVADLRTFAKSDKDHGFPGKVYLDVDGLAYAVKNYEAYDGLEFGIFDKIDDEVIEYKEGVPDEDYDFDEDNVIFRGGEIIKVEDLDENDVLYFLDGLNGARLYLAYAPLEGELEAQTDEEFTIDGKDYEPDSAYFYVSIDSGDTFNDYVMTEDPLDETNFENAAYVKAYDFARLAYIASSEVGTKIIGVITDVASDIVWRGAEGETAARRYTGITLYNAEGKEVNYTFNSDFRDAYDDEFTSGTTGEDITDYLDKDDVPAALFTGLHEGDMVQIVLDKSDKLKSIAGWVPFGAALNEEEDGWDAIIYDVLQKVDVTASSKRVKFDRTYTVSDNCLIFEVTAAKGDDLDGDGAEEDFGLEYDSVGIMSVSALLAADFDAYQLVAFDTSDRLGTVATVIYLVGEGGGMNIGIITAQAQRSSGRTYTINGEVVAGESQLKTGDVPPIVALYNFVDGEAKLQKRLADATEPENADYANGELTTAGVDDDFEAFFGKVTRTQSGRIEVQGAGVFYTADAYIYDMVDEDRITNLRDLEGLNVLVVTEKDEDDALVVAAWSEEDPDDPADEGDGELDVAALKSYLKVNTIAARQTDGASVKVTADDDGVITIAVTGTTEIADATAISTSFNGAAMTLQEIFGADIFNNDYVATFVTFNLKTLLEGAGYTDYTSVYVRSTRDGNAPNYTSADLLGAPASNVKISQKNLTTNPNSVTLVFEGGSTTVDVFDKDPSAAGAKILLTIVIDGTDVTVKPVI